MQVDSPKHQTLPWCEPSLPLGRELSEGHRHRWAVLTAGLSASRLSDSRAKSSLLVCVIWEQS